MTTLAPRPAGLHEGFGWCALHRDAWHPAVRTGCPKCAINAERGQRGQTRTNVDKTPRAGRVVEAAMRDALVAAGWVEGDDFIREHAFALDEGRDYRFDFRFLGTDVALEVEGGAHAIKRQHRNDCEKASLAAALGYRVVRVHRKMIEDGSAVQFVRRAIEFKSAAANAAKGV